MMTSNKNKMYKMKHSKATVVMRWLLTFFMLFFIMLPSSAVLKEKNLDNTLSILRSELTNYYNDLQRQMSFMKDQQETVRNNLMDIFRRSNQNSLMLYSQKPQYIFDLTYACHEATEQYAEFQENVLPFTSLLARTNSEIARYDSLVTNLSQMPSRTLSERAQIDRNVCLTLAVNIRHTLYDNSQQLNDYIRYYNMTDQRLRNLNDYANKRYNDIQASIFSNGGEGYFTILAHFGRQFKDTKLSIEDKYKPSEKMRSQWDSRIIAFMFALIFFYGIVSFILCLVAIRHFLPQRFRTPSFMSKRTCIVLSASVIMLAVLLGLARLIFKDQNFLLMASNLLVEYAWLLGVILTSLLIRLDGSQIKSAFRIYSPLMVVGFIVISFRIVLVPNDVVNLVFPPVLLLCSLWQWNVIMRHNNNIPKSDVFFTYCSLAVFVVSTVCSWVGYTLLSVQVLIWWIMQLTCILTITCLAGLLNQWAKRHDYVDKKVTDVWIFRLVYYVVLRVMGVMSVLISLYWAADVFNLTDVMWKLFSHNFIDSKNLCVSIISIVIVANLYFTFSYLYHTINDLLEIHFEKKDLSTAASHNIMSRKLVQVVVWGVWLLVALAIFHVSNTWLVVISGGLSTGIGFASKDILENIYYGISLMAGRVKIGDWIECDGTRGKVSSISYTSTMIDTVDGSVIAFQNSQLFTKNYKNMTKNHGYELDTLEVGVAYGSDLTFVKQILRDAVMQLDCIYKKRGVKIVVKSLGDNSVNLTVSVWVSVLTHYSDDGEVLECIYNTLNKHNIEIPFPQHDLHLRDVPARFDADNKLQ